MINRIFLFILLLLILSFSQIAYTQENPYSNSYFNGMGFNVILAQKDEHSTRSDHNSNSHDHSVTYSDTSPAGIMGGHTHKPGTLMFVTQFMYMSMTGDLLRGDNNVSITDTNWSGGTPYHAFTLKMVTETHMFGLMYTPIDNLIVMAMLPYIKKTMDMIHLLGGVQYLTHINEGIGDLKLGANYTFFHSAGHHHHLTGELQFGIPTGSINYLSAGDYHYSMQLGSGSYELIPALTYTGEAGSFAWGLRGEVTFRLNSNSMNYRVGNDYAVTAWGAWRFIKWISLSARLNFDKQENIRGEQKNFDPTANPPYHSHEEDPRSFGHTRLEGFAGLNFHLPKLGPLASRIGVEGGIPLYQNVMGIQKGLGWVLNAQLRLSIAF